MSGEERRRLGDELDKTNHQLYRGCVKSRKWHTLLSIIHRLGDASNHFRAVCRMTRSVYTLCGFQKLNPVGFCVFCEICGNYKQRNHK